MNFRRRQSSKGVRNLISGDESRVGDIHSNQHLRCIGARCNRCAASLSFEFSILDTPVADLHPQFHHVTTHGVGNFGYGISVRDLTHTPRILKIIEQLFRITHSLRSSLLVIWRQFAQSFDDSWQYLNHVVDVFRGCHPAEAETQASVCFIGCLADRGEHM